MILFQNTYVVAQLGSTGGCIRMFLRPTTSVNPAHYDLFA